MQRIFRDFDYDKTATTVTSTVADAMRAAPEMVADLPERTRAELVDGLRAVLTRLEA